MFIKPKLQKEMLTKWNLTSKENQVIQWTLLRYWDKNENRVYGKQEDIANDLNLSTRTIKRVLKTLSVKGVIRTYQEMLRTNDKKHIFKRNYYYFPLMHVSQNDIIIHTLPNNSIVNENVRGQNSQNVRGQIVTSDIYKNNQEKAPNLQPDNNLTNTESSIVNENVRGQIVTTLYIKDILNQNENTNTPPLDAGVFDQEPDKNQTEHHTLLDNIKTNNISTQPDKQTTTHSAGILPTDISALVARFNERSEVEKDVELMRITEDHVNAYLEFLNIVKTNNVFIPQYENLYNYLIKDTGYLSILANLNVIEETTQTIIKPEAMPLLFSVFERLEIEKVERKCHSLLVLEKRIKREAAIYNQVELCL